MELKDLIGEREFSGVDFDVEKIPEWTGSDCFVDANKVAFVLDGKTYVATEDPDDGYRSCMSEIIESNDVKVKNVFGPIRVIAKMRDKENHWDCNSDILQLINVKNGKILLEVGTDNTDDYYPWFVSSFHPENM